jgi:hypothetical protein
MSSITDQIQQEFHDKAREVFFAMLHAFQDASSKIDRNKSEYMFQQLKKQYTVSFEKELQDIGHAVLNKYHGSSQAQAIDPALHQFIKDYLHRFNQKITDF